MSRYSGEISAAAFVYAVTYSRKSSPFSRMCRMTPPRKAMSLPTRMGTNVSASALVRVKCGSMWITLAPRALASTTHWNPTGWASAMFEPMITMQSAWTSRCGPSVAPPRPSEVPRPGTVAECQIRAWFSIWMAPSAVKSFLMR